MATRIKGILRWGLLVCSPILATAFHNITQPSPVADGIIDILRDGDEFEIQWEVDATLEAPITILLLRFGLLLEEIGFVPDPTVGSFSWIVSKGIDPQDSDTYAIELLTTLDDGTQLRSTSDEVFILDDANPDEDVTTTGQEPSTTTTTTITIGDTSTSTTIILTTPSPTTTPTPTALPAPTTPNATTKTTDGTRIVIETISGQERTFTLGPSGETLTASPPNADGSSGSGASNRPSGRQVAQIAGGVIGGIIAILLLIGLIWCLRKRSRQSRQNAQSIKDRENLERKYNFPRDAEGRPILDVKMPTWEPLEVPFPAGGEEGVDDRDRDRDREREREGGGGIRRGLSVNNLKEGALKRWRSRRLVE